MPKSARTAETSKSHIESLFMLTLYFIAVRVSGIGKSEGGR